MPCLICFLPIYWSIHDSRYLLEAFLILAQKFVVLRNICTYTQAHGSQYNRGSRETPGAIFVWANRVHKNFAYDTMLMV